MAQVKVSDVGRTATLLKKLIDKADRNQDGRVSNADVYALAPGNPRDPSLRPRQLELKSAVHGAQRYAAAKGSTELSKVKKAVDEIAASVKKADKDKDGKISEAEYKSLGTLAAKRFVDFASTHAHDKVSDFQLAAPSAPPAPRFSWRGSIAEVTTSLLRAYSTPANDNFWPQWGSPAPGASRYVLSKKEAQAMVKALDPLYPSRQKGVIAELSGRTQSSTFGCVSCDAGARAVFTAYAKQLGVTGLTFESPRAPRMPAP